MRRLAGQATLLLVAGLCPGCETAFVDWADTRGALIQAEKVRVVDNFRKDLADPLAPPGQMKGAGHGPGPQSDYEFDVKVPQILQLTDSIRIATSYNRDYINRRENFFLTMIGLDLTRHNFLDPQFAGSISWGGSILNGAKLTESTNLALSGSKLLPSGGSVRVSGGAGIGALDAGNGRIQSTSSNLSINFSQPLLRGAGRTVAWEGLNQAERSAVYAARNFEEFRQSFAINVIRQYYNLVAEKKGVEIVKQTTANQKYAQEEAEALYELNRTTQQDVLRAKQSYRDAENAYLQAKQNYARAKDDFKIFLGLPLATELEIGDEIPPEPKIVIDRAKAIDAALHNRLALQNQRDRFDDAVRGLQIARNSLLPDLNFNAGATSATVGGNSFSDLDWGAWVGTFGLTLEIPLDRVSERNALRSAMIGVAQSRRGLRQTEDQVILEVRDALRQLDTQSQQLRNQRENIETIRRRVIKATLDHRAGTGSNRDVVEANVELAQAGISLLERQVSYYTQVLELRRALGLLFVDKEGRIIE